MIKFDTDGAAIFPLEDIANKLELCKQRGIDIDKLSHLTIGELLTMKYDDLKAMTRTN